MITCQQTLNQLQAAPQTWLITGVAGFIGSNLLEALLRLNQRVVGLDNFATGHQHNLDEVQTLVTPAQWANFRFIRGDIRSLEDCRKAMVFSQHSALISRLCPLREIAGVGRVPQCLLRLVEVR